MLSDLFKPGWKSSSVEKRRKAVAEMDEKSAEAQEILLQLATTEEDGSVRIAAIRRLTGINELHELSLVITDEAVRGEAEKRVNELIGSLSADQAQYQSLLQHYPDLRLRIAAHADSLAVRRQAIDVLTGNELIEVLGATAYTESRQHIAEKLSAIEDLESARKIMRGKDKTAERIIKTRIDAIRAEERQQAENQSRVEKLIEEIEFLAVHDWLPEFKSRCVAHRQQWDHLEFEVNSDSRQRYQKSREIVDKRFEQQQLIEQTCQSQQQLFEELETLIEKTAAKNLLDLAETLGDIQAQQQQLGSRWRECFAVSVPELRIDEQYEKMLLALTTVAEFMSQVAQPDEVDDTGDVKDAGDGNESKQLSARIRQLESALKQLKWPDAFAPLQVVSEIKQQLEECRQGRQAIAEAYAEKLAQVHKHISAIFRFSRNGNLARAKQLAEKVEKALDQFAGRDLLALKGRFDEASSTLGDMGDWKNFATEPKYIELCESMEGLIASEQHPDKCSAEMKALQLQWKKLGHSDIAEQYWERFKLAADQVYASCAEFFEQRHATRKANLEKRQQYVDQMRQLFETTNWEEQPDYRAIQSSVHRISDGFTAVKDVEHRAGQKQWKKLCASKDAVQEKLGVAYDANIALKQQLIDQAAALAEVPAQVENLTKLKVLQTRWKQIGVTRRNQDQKAWSVFKKHGDAVFNKVQALRQEQRVETDEQMGAYRSIIKAILTLAKTADDLAEADHQYALLQEQYAALPELPEQLPEKLIGGIRRDYRHACAQFDSRHSRIIRDRKNQQIEALRQKADICAQLEALGSSASEQQLEDLNQQWDSIKLKDAETLRRIEARRDAARTDIDRVEIGAERRLLCIQLEILKGVDSPQEDKALRMQYQLEQMNKSGLGQQQVYSKELLESMELDWLCKPGAQAALQKDLDARFRRVFRTK